MKNYLIRYRNRYTGRIEEATHSGADCTYAAFAWYDSLRSCNIVGEFISIEEFREYYY